MYREMLAVDLPVVTHVATARSLDIQQAKERVAFNRGRYEASVEALLPVIAPAITFQHFDGSNQNANGTLVSTNFNNVLPAVTLQWIMNPGKAYYDIVASRRRLEASDEQQRTTELDTLRTAAIRYYELMLSRAGWRRPAFGRRGRGGPAAHRGTVAAAAVCPPTKCVPARSSPAGNRTWCRR